MAQQFQIVPAPGVARRLMAMTYDGLLGLGVLFVFTLVVVLMGGGQAVGAGNFWFTVSLLIILFIFFGWSWTHGGQTLGMRSWRMQVQRTDGTALGWQDALKRYGVSWMVLLPALFGLWWALFDRRGMALQDRLSGTRVVLLPKT